VTIAICSTIELRVQNTKIKFAKTLNLKPKPLLENTYVKKLEFKDNQIIYYEERYDEHNGYYLWTNEKCRIIKRIIKEKIY
jgi:hypothetical protein